MVAAVAENGVIGADAAGAALSNIADSVIARLLPAAEAEPDDEQAGADEPGAADEG